MWEAVCFFWHPLSCLRVFSSQTVEDAALLCSANTAKPNSVGKALGEAAASAQRVKDVILVSLDADQKVGVEQRRKEYLRNGGIEKETGIGLALRRSFKLRIESALNTYIMVG